jgi:hypothetical protein
MKLGGQTLAARYQILHLSFSQSKFTTMPPRSRGQISTLLWRALTEVNRPAARNISLCLKGRNGLIALCTFYPRPPLCPSLRHCRTFTTTPSVLKKKDKSKKNAKFASNDTPDDDGQVPSSRAEAEVPDPHDFSELEAGIAKALGRLKDALGKTRNAGRVSVEMIEGLGVELRDAGAGKGVGGGVHRVKLGDIATVVPKGGRMVQLYAQEEGVSLSLSISFIAMALHELPPPSTFLCFARAYH